MPGSYSNWDVVCYILYIRGGVNSGWYLVHHRKRGGYIGVFIRGCIQGWVGHDVIGKLGEPACCCSSGGIASNLGTLSFVYRILWFQSEYCVFKTILQARSSPALHFM
jgi:hypothetical protein